VRALSVACTLTDQARAWRHDADLSNRPTDHAIGLLGHDAILTAIGPQNPGRLPNRGTPAWEQFINLAEAGGVEIATVILIRAARENVCEDRVIRRVREDLAAPPANPLDLANEKRAKASFSRRTDRWRSRSPITLFAVRILRTLPSSATADGP
jgi:hypothetical protein